MKPALTVGVFLAFLSVSSLNAQISNDDFTSVEGSNIGNPKLKGSYSYNSGSQVYSLKGAGYNIWNERDEFFFLSKPAKGNLLISANLAFTGAGVDPHRKAGLMFRASLDEDAAYVDVSVHGDGLTSLQYRSTRGGITREVATNVRAPEFVQLEKTGNIYMLRISKNNTPPDEVASVEIDLGADFHVGMFVCSHNAEVMEQARFWNVRLDVAAEYAGGDKAPPSPSRLEILDIGTGMREVVYSSEKHFEAPNWSRNGKFLIFNQEGRLYRFDLKLRRIKLINTDFATSNNNDHGISFDGKMLAISNHTQVNGSRQSIIYTVPVKGGTPSRVTRYGPSYWHGWSPDDQWHVYCAARNGEYDVYKIPASGGEEIRLTTSPGLDDGPEYSPCGKYIYFNSVRSGTMQIWRMAPDGSNQEQVTFDEYNDWFAHPSPDGKWLLFISYLPDVPAASHPRNKQVMLRLMAVDGKDIKAVAYLYGGQGTINVPSWSPDSKKVAFVSYTY